MRQKLNEDMQYLENKLPQITLLSCYGLGELILVVRQLVLQKQNWYEIKKSSCAKSNQQ